MSELSKGPDGDAVLIIVQHGGHVVQVVTDKTGYDFDWCERDQCHYFHDSGDCSAYHLGPFVERPAPGDATIWAADSVSFTDGEEKPRSRQELVDLYGYTFVAEPPVDPFADGQDSRVEYCEVCKDYLPEDDYCRHLFEDSGAIYGCGSAEVSAEGHRESFLRLVRGLGCEDDLRAAPSGGRFQIREVSPLIGRSHRRRGSESVHPVRRGSGAGRGRVPSPGRARPGAGPRPEGDPRWEAVSARPVPEQRPGRSEQVVETDPRLILASVKRFGSFALDLAATRENAQAPKFLGLPETDSLAIPWERLRAKPGDIWWLNCQYADADLWTRKCRLYQGRGPATILSLTPASVSSRWFRENVFGYAAVLALNPKPTFVGHTSQYPKDMILSVYYPRPVRSFEVWQWRK